MQKKSKPSAYPLKVFNYQIETTYFNSTSIKKMMGLDEEDGKLEIVLDLDLTLIYSANIPPTEKEKANCIALVRVSLTASKRKGST